MSLSPNQSSSCGFVRARSFLTAQNGIFCGPTRWSRLQHRVTVSLSAMLHRSRHMALLMFRDRGRHVTNWHAGDDRNNSTFIRSKDQFSNGSSSDIRILTMGRWTQFEEDAYRLPEGMKRTAYDADTKMYTFRDRNGTLYRGAPGEDYGTLTPVSDTGGSVRPGAFESDEPRKSLSVKSGDRPSTFQDILPANLITATTSPVDKPLLGSTSSTSSSDRDPRALWREAVGRSALPKMQGVVHNLRRSVTSTRRKARASGEDEGLLRRSGSSDLQRAPSVATTRTAVSLDIPMSVNHRK